MADNVAITAGAGTAIGADDISSVWYQRIKLVHGPDGTNDGDVSATNGLPVRPAACSTATLSNVNDTATSTSLLASAATRKGVIVHNDSTSSLYLKYGTTASATSYTYKLDAGAHWEMPSPIYTGAIDGIWSADASGAARITELT